MKKNITIYIASLALLFGATQCDVLDKPVLGLNADTPEYYNNIENAEMAIGGCYYGLVHPTKHGAYRWLYGDIRSDDAEKGGGGPDDGKNFRFIKSWTNDLDGSIHEARAPWIANYKVIYFTNTVIKGIEPATFDENLKKRFLAEAKFIRAYSYFWLVSCYGDVPLLTDPVLDPTKIKDVRRTPYEQVLAHIEKDLDEAAADLPPSYAASEGGRITSGAAKALKARIVMYSIGIFKTRPSDATNWKVVYDLANEVIASGKYALHPNYPFIFETEGELCSESIFEIEYKTTKTGWLWANQGTPTSVFVASRGTTDKPEWGWGFNNPTQNLVNEFEPNDPRLYETVHGRGITKYLYGKEVLIDEAKAYLTGYAARKLAVSPEEQPSQHTDSPANERIIRYADVLMMKAEAAFHMGGKESETRALINEIRGRARTSTYPKGYMVNTNVYTNTGFTNNLPDIPASVTGDALMAAIKHERRVEFGMEGLRFWDLLRWGDYKATLSAAEQARYTKRLFKGIFPVLPLPTEEVVSWGLEDNPR